MQQQGLIGCERLAMSTQMQIGHAIHCRRQVRIGGTLQPVRSLDHRTRTCLGPEQVSAQLPL
jgi:hypothetical protein